jgi:ABC-type cobalamin transport system ATPase subunit
VDARTIIALRGNERQREVFNSCGLSVGPLLRPRGQLFLILNPLDFVRVLISVFFSSDAARIDMVGLLIVPVVLLAHWTYSCCDQ